MNKKPLKESLDCLGSARSAASRADLSGVFRLVYLSRATVLFSEADLREIGKKSEIRNAELDITGILVRDRSQVLQVLEGEEEAVMGLFEKISADPRHESVRQVGGGIQSSRYLSCWSLASGEESCVPEGLREDFHAMCARFTERAGLCDILPEEVDLLKVMALFRSLPKA